MTSSLFGRFVLSCVFTLLLLAGCDDGGVAAPSSPADQTYTVRARLLELPADGKYLQVHHEVIEEFVNRDGKVTGMKEMAMEFADLSPDAARTVKSMSPGDAVEIAFEVRWTTEPRMWVTGIRRLKDDEPLRLLKTLQPE
jgi:hypothetical protein